MDTKQSREALKALRDEIETALGAVLDNNPGLQLKLDRCTFDYSGGFKFALVGTLPGGKSKDETAYERLRAALAIPEALYGNVRTPDGKVTYQKIGTKEGIKLPPLGTAFSHNGKRYVIKGATRSKVIAERPDGKAFVWKPELVAKLTQREAEAV